ncbi:MAG TPA: proton-conducting transporter membrane subunit [Acidimicrobiia bacterium]|nr:proton-conducting transporter membrane subunit [Acidimicrobiia bacterium]
MTNIAPLPVVVPLVGAAAVLFAHLIVPRRVVQAFAMAAVLAEICLAAVLIHQVRSTSIVYWFGGWTPRGAVALGISFTVDQIGAGAALLAGVVSAAAVAVAPSTMRDPDGIVYALFLTLLAAMAGFCLTGDLFNMFVFFELMAVSAFALSAYDTRSPDALRGALNFAITNSIGAFLVLIGIALLYSSTGALNLAQIGHQLARTGLDNASTVALSLLLAGFLIKAAVIPFHFWLIDTATTAPTPLVMILAGVLDTLGVYGVARVYWTVFASPLAADHRAVQFMLVAVGAISALVAGTLSILFSDPRRRMAFVMVAHTGIVLIGVACLSARGVAGAAIYAVGDGTVKAALFIGLALIGFETAHGQRQDHDVAGSPSRTAGLAVLIVGGLATAGLPLFATGLGKASIEKAAAVAGFPWAVVAIVFAAAVTGGAVLNIASTARRATGPRRDEHACAWVPQLLVASILFGISALTTKVGTWAATAAGRFSDTLAYQQRVLSGAATSPAGIATRYATTFPWIVLDLLSVAAAIVLGSGLAQNTARRLSPSPMRSGIWTAIRRVHDGSIGDSATWVTLGTAGIALVLATTMH